MTSPQSPPSPQTPTQRGRRPHAAPRGRALVASLSLGVATALGTGMAINAVIPASANAASVATPDTTNPSTASTPSTTAKAPTVRTPAPRAATGTTTAKTAATTKAS